MSEKRFTFDREVEFEIYDTVTKKSYDGAVGCQEKLVGLLNEQQDLINLLLDLLYQSEATVIGECSIHIGEDMDKLDKIFKEKDIKEIERFVRGCDDE